MPWKPKKTTLFVDSVALIALVVVVFMSQLHNNPLQNPAQKDTETTTSNTATEFNKSQFSIDDPDSQWVIVNKKRPLNPKSYAPSDLVSPKVPLRSGGSEMTLRKVTAGALEEMTAAAKTEGVNLMLASGYRSYALQVSVYDANVKSYGQAGADTQSARPGYSEHQTGLTADVGATSRKCEIAECFGDLPEGKWVAAHSHEYGFIVRYQKDKQSITGYKYEPWHIRFVGKELSRELYKSKTTPEEFFGLSQAANY